MTVDFCGFSGNAPLPSETENVRQQKGQLTFEIFLEVCPSLTSSLTLTNIYIYSFRVNFQNIRPNPNTFTLWLRLSTSRRSEKHKNRKIASTRDLFIFHSLNSSVYAAGKGGKKRKQFTKATLKWGNFPKWKNMEDDGEE